MDRKDEDEKVDSSNDREKVDSTRDIALKRCKKLVEEYLDLKKKHYWRSFYTQTVSLFCVTITPVVLLIPIDDRFVKIFAAATSAGAAISTGLLSIWGSRESYVRCGYTYHALESEMNRYKTKASSDYANLDEEKAAQNFSNRIEEICMAEVTDWRSEMQHIEQKRPTNDNNDTEDKPK